MELQREGTAKVSEKPGVSMEPSSTVQAKTIPTVPKKLYFFWLPIDSTELCFLNGKLKHSHKCKQNLNFFIISTNNNETWSNNKFRLKLWIHLFIRNCFLYIKIRCLFQIRMVDDNIWCNKKIGLKYKTIDSLEITFCVSHPTVNRYGLSRKLTLVKEMCFP